MLFWRSDGTRLRGLDPMRRMMPMLMPTRNEAVVYYEQIIDATALLAFLDAHNAGAGPKLTPLHCVVAALGRVVTRAPALDRFVAGRRLWQRKQPSDRVRGQARVRRRRGDEDDQAAGDRRRGA
jgi:hypothetical protein